MGSCDFWTKAEGKTAQEAFNNATETARYESGHGGYTGTIAEKSEFCVVECPVGVGVIEHCRSLEESGDFPFDDKWGPAGCVALTQGHWLFFGAASS